MKGAGQPEHRRRWTTLGSALISVFATLALVFQLFVTPCHQAQYAPLGTPTTVDVASVATTLKATFGNAAALCIQTDGKDRPAAPADGCDDHCPLCHFATQLAAFVPPDSPALPARLDLAIRTLGAQPEIGAVPFPPTTRTRARAPPFAV